MATSPEYPDLPWMPPKSWTDANRTNVQLIVIHTTEGSEHAQSAEDGASYDQRRTDGTSTHYFHDCDSTVQCVRTEDQAHAARTQGNKRGIQHELCADAADTWNDSYHQAVLHRAAKQAARDAKKWGIPIKKLSSSQVAAGNKGFCGHAEITYAFPQDGGTHTDPGTNFPWSQFLAMVEEEGDDVSEIEAYNGSKRAINEIFARTDQDTRVDDGRTTSKSGLDVWYHGVPNGKGAQEKAYDVINDMATAIYQLVGMVTDLQEQVAVLTPPPPSA